MITFQNHPVIWCLVVGFILAVLIAWCMAGYMALKHAPLVEDVPAPSSPGLRPEEAERPHLLPHKQDPVTPDRPEPLYFASPSDRLGFALAAARARLRMERMELEEKRNRAIAAEIEEMVGEVREGDPR